MVPNTDELLSLILAASALLLGASRTDQGLLHPQIAAINFLQAE